MSQADSQPFCGKPGSDSRGPDRPWKADADTRPVPATDRAHGTAEARREGRNDPDQVLGQTPRSGSARHGKAGHSSASHAGFPGTADERRWIMDNLPAINERFERGLMTAADFYNAVAPQLRAAVAKFMPYLGKIGRDDARRAIQVLGFLVGSLERQFQSAGRPAGEGLAAVPGLDELLVGLGSVADHPPRDSHYTYWLWNPLPDPMSFTGNPQEHLFNRAVGDTNRFHGDSCAAVRPICSGDVDIASPDAADRIGQAATNTHGLFVTWGLFTARDESGGVGMTPEFFMTRMRTYLPAFPVGGTEWGGVNAAHEVTQMGIDFLTGTVQPWYTEVVAQRLRYLTAEDRAALVRDMDTPSLVVRLIDRLGLSEADVLLGDVGELARMIAGQGDGYVASLRAYDKLFTEAGRLTSRHWALIINYLKKPMARLTPEELAKMPVKPTRGTGGADHQATEAIMIMRKQHAPSLKLRAALALLGTPPR